MIYNRMGQGIMVDGVFYAAGMRVYANDTSDYARLYGVITEIRTGDDRETENDTPDIHCQFDAPVLPAEIKELEARFSDLYRKPMKLVDIALDMVIMAPEMLEPSIDPHRANPEAVVWAVIEDWCIDGEGGHNEALYKRWEDANAIFHEQLHTEYEEGCIQGWMSLPHFQLDADEAGYECWLNGDYLSNHYKITLEQKPVVLGLDEGRDLSSETQ